MEIIKYGLGFTSYFFVSNEGRGGGLALLWKSHVQLDIAHFSKSHIHACVKIGDVVEDPWFLTGIYGQSEATRRHETWALIKSIMVPQDKAWLLVGDFNEILSNSEKKVGRVRAECQMAEFRVILHDCMLTDLGFKDPRFTRSNGRQEGHCISERLDKFLANLTWCGAFPMMCVEHIPVAYSIT